jgi:hypothetical protein
LLTAEEPTFGEEAVAEVGMDKRWL